MHSMNTSPPQRSLPVLSLPASSDVVSTQILFRDRQVLLIEHAGERYQLRLTKNGKLILTK